MVRPARALALLGLASACTSSTGDDVTRAKSSTPAARSASATAKPNGSVPALVPTAGAPSASAITEPVPLSAGANERPKLEGVVAFVGKLKGHAEALYAASLTTLPLEPTRLAETGSDWSIGEPALDPTGKTVAFTHDHRENSSAPPDEIWTVAITGAALHRVARCTATCRSPHFLEDGRIAYVDHGIGLGAAAVRSVSPSGAISTLYDGDRSTAACFVGLHVDPLGKYLAIRVANELGWPECNVDRTLAASASDLQLKPLPATVPGSSGVRAGFDGRLYFSGVTDERPIPSSIKIDGTDLRAPDPLFDGEHVPQPGWSLEVVGTTIVARPPAADPRRAVVVFEAEEIGALYHTQVR